MATLTSQEILNATVSMGVSKANQCWIARAANTLLAGMYIAIGGFLAIRIGLALPWEQWGGMSKLIFGAVFPLGLMLVVLCGADLFTGSCMTLTTAQAKQKISFGQTVFTLATSWLGNFAGALFVVLCGADLFTGSCMTLTTAQAKQKISFGQTVFTLATSWLGNFAGALFVAFFIAYLSGLIFESAGGTMPWAAAVVNLANAKCSLGFTEALLRGIGCNWLVCLAVFLIFESAGGTMPWAAAVVNLANAKCSLGFTEALLRGIGCNWLVCLAVFAAAASTETIGKIAALWFPTMAFVALGMEHCIANMFCLNGNDRQDRGSLVPDDGFRCLGHGALHCQYVFHSARNPDRNRSPLHRISRSREGRST